MKKKKTNCNPNVKKKKTKQTNVNTILQKLGI